VIASAGWRKRWTLTRELHGQQQDRARRREERAFGKNKAVSGGESEPERKRNNSREKEPRASTTDPEARVMKMADGGFRPAYNVQFASDTQSGAVAGVAVDNNGSDMGKMAPMNEALAADYGERPRQHLAGWRYAKFDDIEALENAGVEVYATVPGAARQEPAIATPRSPTMRPAIAAWRERMGSQAGKRHLQGVGGDG